MVSAVVNLVRPPAPIQATPVIQTLVNVLVLLDIKDHIAIRVRVPVHIVIIVHDFVIHSLCNGNVWRSVPWTVSL